MAESYEIDAISDRDDVNLWGNIPDPMAPLKLDDLEDANHLVIRTKNVALPYITPDMPHAGDLSLKGRMTVGAPDASEKSAKRTEGTPAIVRRPALAQTEKMLELFKDSLEATVAERESYPPEPQQQLQFPNFALEAVLAGLAKERQTNEKLNGHIKEAEGHQKDIDLLLDLSAELTAMKGEKNEVPERVKTILAQLKERGIDLVKGENQTHLTKEQISELKSLGSAQVDQLRSKLQILFTTKIQFLVQAISAILECVKDMIRNDSRIKNKANTLPGH